MTVKLAFPGGTSIPKCRLCDARADLVVKTSDWTSEGYAYCASCVNKALERAEVRR